VRPQAHPSCEDEELRLRLLDTNKNQELKLLVQAEDADERQVWLDLLSRHCAYATKF
jgi:hypothetical protein